MRRLWLLPIFGWSVWATGITLECSNLIPDPGNSVVLFARGAPPGASFRWDLDGDGVFEHTTGEPKASFIARQGSRVVRVEVVSAGKTLGQVALIVTADSRLGAIRSIVREDNSFLVTIQVRAKLPVIAPGLAEEIPAGSALEVVADGGAFWRRAEKLEVVWPLILDPQTIVAFSYRLYPVAQDFRVFGLVSGYVAGSRAEIQISGQFQP